MFRCLYLPGECGMCPAPKIKHPFICKVCHVPVVSRADRRAILGKEHATWCPRRKK